MLILPPTNHLANGSFHARMVSHFFEPIEAFRLLCPKSFWIGGGLGVDLFVLVKAFDVSICGNPMEAGRDGVRSMWIRWRWVRA